MEGARHLHINNQPLRIWKIQLHKFALLQIEYFNTLHIQQGNILRHNPFSQKTLNTHLLEASYISSCWYWSPLSDSQFWSDFIEQISGDCQMTLQCFSGVTNLTRPSSKKSYQTQISSKQIKTVQISSKLFEPVQNHSEQCNTDVSVEINYQGIYMVTVILTEIYTLAYFLWKKEPREYKKFHK